MNQQPQPANALFFFLGIPEQLINLLFDFGRIPVLHAGEKELPEQKLYHRSTTWEPLALDVRFHFIEKVCRKFNKPVLPMSLADVRKLQTYNWPGNIRELENMIERAVIVSGTGKLRIDIPELNQSLLQSDEQAQDHRAESAFLVQTEDERRANERANLISALKQCGGKVAGRDGAARLLGVKPTTLYSRIQRWRIDTHAYKPQRATLSR